jgi:hypothetical protein
MFRFIFCAVALTGFTATYEKTSHCPNGKRHYRAAIRHIERGGIGYEYGYTTAEVFFASDPSYWKVTPFFDARGHVFDNGKSAANAGAGLRVLWRNRAYGINTYYDYRNTGRFHSNQIGAGIETLGELFDFRINGYLPVGAKTSDVYDTAFAAFSGHYLLLSQKIESAMKGADAEFGFHFGKSNSFDFYAAAGPYYFIGKDAPATWGGKARISGVFKDILTLEISDSYDRTFQNKFQGQVALSFSFGPKSKIEQRGRTCKGAKALNNRMLQSVKRQEIIVIDKTKKNTVAINPVTGLPYFFVFVDNTSSSNGTYESPYPSLAQAQDSSSPHDVLYVFPGDGTTTGMDSGIYLKENQIFWGSGVTHSIQTSQGAISIPAQSSSSPMITNTNINTEGNAINLETNNTISGFIIASAINDAIYGTDLQSLEVSSCTFEDTGTFAIEASFSGDASISVTNNQFLDNTNGIFLNLEGTSTILCSENTFRHQLSVSSVPLEITTHNNNIMTRIENNVFDSNTTGSIRFNINNVTNADILLLKNTITNNGTGFQASLGSSFVIIPDGITTRCSIVANGNTFSSNTSNSFYLHSSGAFTTLEIAASGNTLSDNGGSALVLATPTTDTLTLLATDNTITGISDNGISVIGSISTSIGNIVINNNAFANIGNISNGIAINQDFSTLTLTLLNNTISECEGSGILSFPSTSIDFLTLNISDNTISNCQNGSGNAASGISFDNYSNLTATVANNTLLGNTAPGVAIGALTSGNPTVCLMMSDNSSNTDPGYFLTNPGSGAFNLSPCNADSINTGTISTSGGITYVQSCPNAAPCL